MKKAQIRMSETIGVLFIFFVLILFGIIFYANYQKIAFKEKQEQLLGERAMDLSLHTLFLPELVCTDGRVGREANCFDMQKLDNTKDVFAANLESYYFELFSYANISVHQVSLDGSEEKVWVLYDEPKPDFERKERTYFVVALKKQYTPFEEEYQYGYLKVEVYQ